MAQAKHEHHEVIIIGFGPAAVSLGIALKENHSTVDFICLEPQSKSTWKPLAELPGHIHMTFSFLNDLVTLQNPRSRFTFIQFLHQRKLLVDFTNLGLMQPNRALFEEYIRWCAKSLEPDVHYSTEILSIEPAYSGRRKIDGWSVFIADRETRERKLYTGKKIVFCMGQQPSLPSVLSSKSLIPAVVHSSHCMDRLGETIDSSKKDVRIAIIGQTRAAAELFDELYDIRADRTVTWLVEDSSIVTDTESALNAYGPLNANHEANLPPEMRLCHTSVPGSSTQGIDKALVDRIYEIEYAQSIKQPDSKQWKFRVDFNQSITEAKTTDEGRIQLTCRNEMGVREGSADFDLVICATGFQRSPPETLLSSLMTKRLLDGSSINVDAEYAINLRRGVLEPDTGIWCMGTIGDPEHAVGEASFTLVAERSARIAESLSKCKDSRSTQNQQKVQAQL